MSAYLMSSICRRALFALMCALCTTISFATDPVSREAFKSIRLRHDKESYRRVTGNEPTLDRLIASLNIREAHGARAEEIVSALGILKTMTDIAGKPETVSAIETCYAQNSFYLIQVKCADALLELRSPKGLILAEKIMQSDVVPVDGKIMMCNSLVSTGILSCYGFVKKIYLTGSDHQKLLARETIRRLEQYNGREWNAKGDRIDTEQLLSAKPDTQPPAKRGNR